MSNESYKRPRNEPKNYNLNRNYTVKRQRNSEVSTSKKKSNSNGDVLAILDVGGSTLKYGYSSMDEPMVMPNCIIKARSERKRPFIGDQIEECRDLSGLYYLIPHEKGYITRWDIQKQIWDYLFQQFSIDDQPLMITQPLLNFRDSQDCLDEIFFEDFEVPALVRINSTDLSQYNHASECDTPPKACVIVESGYSFTHIVPYIEGKKVWNAVKRIDVGGKFLTNYMKEIISYRQLHVMEETFVINQVKEDACFVSLDFKEDMKIAQRTDSKNSIVRNYVLPDFNNIRRGYIQEPGTTLPETVEGCQILRLNNERFTVPELLLHPSSIPGMRSVGIAEGIHKAIKACPERWWPSLTKNVVLTGGNAMFPGFRERVYKDVRSFLPYFCTLNVKLPENPITYSWSGGKALCKHPDLQKLIVTRQEYIENGSDYTYEKFNDMSAFTYEEIAEEEEEAPKISLLSRMKGRSIFGKHDASESEEEAIEKIDLDTDDANNKSVEESVSEESPPGTDSSEITTPIANSTPVKEKSSVIQFIKIPQSLINQTNVKLTTVKDSQPSGTSTNQGSNVVRAVGNCITLGDILKAAGATNTNNIKIAAPGIVRSGCLQGVSQQSIIRLPNTGNQPIRLRIHHYPMPQLTNKNQTLSRLGAPPTQNIIKLPVSTANINGQQIAFIRSDGRANINPILTQIPQSIASSSGQNQILRLNYSIPKLTAIKPGGETSSSTSSDSSVEKKGEKTVVYVKQVYLKKPNV